MKPELCVLPLLLALSLAAPIGCGSRVIDEETHEQTVADLEEANAALDAALEENVTVRGELAQARERLEKIRETVRLLIVLVERQGERGERVDRAIAEAYRLLNEGIAIR